MRRLLDTLRTRFDRILIDVPPVAPLADLHILAPMVDGLLMIVRAGVTPKPAIERALAGLDASKVLGLVLNESGGERTDSYNYEGYGYIAGDEQLGAGARQRHELSMQLFNRYVSTRSLTVFGGELLLIFGSVALAASVQTRRPSRRQSVEDRAGDVVCQLCLYYNDFYDLTLVHSHRELVVRLLQAVGAASIVLAALYFTVPALMIGDGIFVSALFVFLVGILGWRLLFNHLTGSLRMQERILFVGTGETARTGGAADPRAARLRLLGRSASSTTMRRASASASSIPRSSARRPTSRG